MQKTYFSDEFNGNQKLVLDEIIENAKLMKQYSSKFIIRESLIDYVIKIYRFI